VFEPIKAIIVPYHWIAEKYIYSKLKVLDDEVEEINNEKKRKNFLQSQI